jgi:serine/threonine-protein kinase
VSGIINDRYRKEALLGSGGLGTVYKATDLLTGERVALKVYRDLSEYIDSEEILNRARLISDIAHRNVVRIKNAGISGNSIFIVMEHLDGHDLQSHIRPGYFFSWDSLKYIAVQACEGFQALHDRRITHKDVKSANIFLTEDGDVKILDFDLSQSRLLKGKAGFGNVKGSFFGTPSNASPEEARGKPYDHRVDIYALGVVLYEAVSGILPFIGPDPVSTLNMRLNRLPLAPSKVCPTLAIPPLAESVILKAMEHNPEDRFQSMSDMRDAIIRA